MGQENTWAVQIRKAVLSAKGDQNAVDAQKTSFVGRPDWPSEHQMPDLVRHLKGAFQPANGAERPDQVTRGFIA